MEVFICDHVACDHLDELNTFDAVARLKDGRYISLIRPHGDNRRNIVGTLQKVTDGELTRWKRPIVPPKVVPQIRNYTFVKASQLGQPDAYVGLWRDPRNSTRQTLVVLFDGGNVDDPATGSNCGPYRIIASLDRQVDHLETRYLLHEGNAVNLANYNKGSRLLWLARMILPEGALGCDQK